MRSRNTSSLSIISMSDISFLVHTLNRNSSYVQSLSVFKHFSLYLHIFQNIILPEFNDFHLQGCFEYSRRTSFYTYSYASTMAASRTFSPDGFFLLVCGPPFGEPWYGTKRVGHCGLFRIFSAESDLASRRVPESVDLRFDDVFPKRLNNR